MTERATGRLVQHDPQSRAYAAPRRALRPASWLHPMGPVLDQGQLNGCTGFAAANWLNSSRALVARARWNRLVMERDRSYLDGQDATSIYSQATKADPFKWTWPPTDGGSSGLGVAKALKAAGVIDAYLWTFSFDQMLAQGQAQPVLVGTIWTDAMGDPDSKGVIHLGTDRQIRSALDGGMGHEWVLRGVRWDRKLARIRNQWSSDWGINGEALIPLAELERAVIDYQGDVMVPQIASAA